jgi:hypothetical protein
MEREEGLAEVAKGVELMQTGDMTLAARLPLANHRSASE